MEQYSTIPGSHVMKLACSKETSAMELRTVGSITILPKLNTTERHIPSVKSIEDVVSENLILRCFASKC